MSPGLAPLSSFQREDGALNLPCITGIGSGSQRRLGWPYAHVQEAGFEDSHPALCLHRGGLLVLREDSVTAARDVVVRALPE